MIPYACNQVCVPLWNEHRSHSHGIFKFWVHKALSDLFDLIGYGP